MSNPSGLCKCGCGSKTTLAARSFLSRGIIKGEPNDYIQGHQNRGVSRVDVSGIEINKSGLCKCGCGQRTSLATGTNRKLGIIKGQPRDYINGHGKTGRRFADVEGIPVNEGGLCLCGCGTPTPIAPFTNRQRGWVNGKPTNYIRGHSPLTKTGTVEIQSNESGLCMCGCGAKTKIATESSARYGHVKGKHLNYLPGHSSRGRTADWRDLNHSGLCLCGCGKKTPIAKYTMRTKGIKEGVPLRYVDGHGPKTAKLDRYETKYTGYETPCWIWTGFRDVAGYGRLGAKSTLAHRANYEKVHGPLDPGLHLHHLCEQKACVNPDHLEPLTNADHIRRHTAQREKVSSAKVEEIREDLRTTTDTQNTVAARHGVSPSFVWNIKHGRR